MRTKLIPTAVGLLALVAGGFAKAGDVKPYFEARQDRQMHRIVKGVQNGSLTPNEALELRQQQRHIYRKRHKFLADGRLAKHERRTLERKFDRASERIRDLKHNRHHGYPDPDLRRVGHVARGQVVGHRHGGHGKHGHKHGGHRYGGHKHGHKHGGHRYGGHKHHGHKRHGHKHRRYDRHYYEPRYYGRHRHGHRHGRRHYDDYDDYRWWFGFGLWN